MTWTDNDYATTSVEQRSSRRLGRQGLTWTDINWLVFCAVQSITVAKPMNQGRQTFGRQSAEDVRTVITFGLKAFCNKYHSEFVRKKSPKTTTTKKKTSLDVFYNGCFFFNRVFFFTNRYLLMEQCLWIFYLSCLCFIKYASKMIMLPSTM